MPRSKPSDAVVTIIPAALRPNRLTPTSRRRRLTLALAAVAVLSLVLACVLPVFYGITSEGVRLDRRHRHPVVPAAEPAEVAESS